MMLYKYVCELAHDSSLPKVAGLLQVLWFPPALKTEPQLALKINQSWDGPRGATRGLRLFVILVK